MRTTGTETHLSCVVVIHPTPALQVPSNNLERWRVTALDLKLGAPRDYCKMIWGSEEQLIGSWERQCIGKKLNGRPGGWQRRCRHLLDYFGLSGCGVQFHVGPLVRCARSLTGGERRLFDLEAGQKLTAKDGKQLCWLEKALLWQIEDKAAALIGPYSCGLV